MLTLDVFTNRAGNLQKRTTRVKHRNAGHFASILLVQQQTKLTWSVIAGEDKLCLTTFFLVI